jgi:phospholipid N-methyltransferase
MENEMTTSTVSAPQTTTPAITGSATYSPEDNKLRLYASERLPRELYERVKAAGFRWAPQQKLFFAPMWTPEREDLLLELCGDIGDEDTSLAERAEERAERFEGYRENRAADADSARQAVKAITSGIPLGQPILIGHHSQKRAERDAERIERGMARAVKMWSTAAYWQRRAANALEHAKYKELPEVRHRRIAGLESDLRVLQSRYTPDPKTKPQVWDGETHVWCGKGRGGHWVKESRLSAIKEHCERWEEHYRNRIAYERAMLAEDGGIAAEGFDIQKGGRVLVRGEWLVVTKINKSGGQIVSVTTNARYVRVKGIEEIKDYRAPTAAEMDQVRKATKLPPLVNYRKEGCLELTAAQWKSHERAQSGYAKRFPATPEYGGHRQRLVMRGGRLVHAFIVDSKEIPCPPASAGESVVLPRERVAIDAPPRGPAPVDQANAEFDAMRGILRNGGVKVVSAPQLFPTPAALAQRMVEEAGIRPGHRVLEPSAGTGRLLEAVRAAGGLVTAIEINYELVQLLRTNYDDVRQADFLRCGEELGKFDCVVANPPFEAAQDIAHIKHAMQFLKPGGRIVALCANGPRQARELGALAEKHGGIFEPLPEGTFAAEGTNVRVALLVIDKSE